MTTPKMTLETKSVAHDAASKTADKVVDVAKSSYLVVVLLVLGIVALITAVLVAWPALAYIAAKLF